MFRLRVAPRYNAHKSLPSDPESWRNDDLVQTFFERSFAMNRLRQGPLAGHIDLLAARLAADGYSRVHSRIQLRLVGHFNRWLQQKDLTVEQIDEDSNRALLALLYAKKASAAQRRVRADEATRSFARTRRHAREQHRGSSDPRETLLETVPLLPARGA